MTPAVQRVRHGAQSFSASANAVFKTEGMPCMLIWCVSSTAGSIKVKGTDLPDVAEADATWKTLRSTLNAGTSTETELDPDTASGTLAVGDFILVDTQGMAQIQCARAAGSGSLRATLFEEPIGALLLMQKLKDSGLATTNTPPAINVYRFIPDGTDELLIDATARKYWGARVFTLDATPVYVKTYDKATAPSESDTPISGVESPANATAANGAGNTGNAPWPVYKALTNGLGVRAVTGLADNNDSALTTAENIVEVYWST